MKKNEITEPKAEKIDKVMTIHDHQRVDEFYWLNERENPKVIEYLNAENNYRDQYMEDYKSLEEGIFNEIKSRIKEDDSSVPYLDNGYYYYTRYEKGKQYPIYCRKKENLSSKAQNVMRVLQSKAYTRIELDAPAIWVNNTYDVQIHEFRSPSSNDKVVVYQRVNYQ